MNSSPLGKYAEGVAAVVALAIIFSWLFALLFNPAGITSTLNDAAWVALGFIFGRQLASGAVATTANSTRIDALEKRLSNHDT